MVLLNYQKKRRVKSLEAKLNTTEYEQDIEIIVTEIIQKLGIPAHIRGYQYLRYALILSVENSEMTTSVTKFLYPAVAEKFNTSYKNIASGISRAIKLIWDKGNEEALRFCFGDKIYIRKEKPTNTEFIAAVSDMLRLKFKRLKQK